MQPPNTNELQEIFDIKYGTNCGPNPRRRRAFGYYLPADQYEAIVNKCVHPETTWLDLGGGSSLFPENPRLSDQLSDRCSRLVAIDPSENVLQNPYAHEQFQGYLGGYAGQKDFSLITLRMVAEHVADPNELVADLSRCIAPGGLVVIFTVWIHAPVTWISRITPFAIHHPIKKFFWGGEEKDTFPTEYKMNSGAVLKSLFAKYGFEPELVMLCGDCSVTGKMKWLNSVELSVWWAMHRMGLPYPESCVLAVFKRI